MLTIIYIYFNFTIINIFLLIVQTGHFAKTRNVDEMDWVLLRMSCAGLQVKDWAELEQVTRRVHEE